MELLQIGSLAMTKVSAAPLEGFIPEMQIFGIPYIFKNRRHYWKVLESDIGKDLLLSMQRVKLHGLGYFDAGARSFYTTKKPIRSPKDLAGQKIRVMNSQTAIKTVNALGATPTPISWGELYTALQQGVVDGAENNPPTFYLSRQYEISKYYVLDEHSAIPDVLLMSLYIWNNLSAQEKQWLAAAVKEGVLYQRELWEKATKDALKAVEAAGVKVIYPDKRPFQRAVQGMYRQYEGSEVGVLIQRIRNVR